MQVYAQQIIIIIISIVITVIINNNNNKDADNFLKLVSFSGLLMVCRL